MAANSSGVPIMLYINLNSDYSNVSKYKIQHFSIKNPKIEVVFTLSMLWTISADDKLMIFFLFYLENRIRHFMQTVS